MKLLYRTAEWHGLAKLRMHTESSLVLLESLTTEFGLLMQNFQELTCTEFATMDFLRETTARQRRDVNNQAATSSSSTVRQTSCLGPPNIESAATTQSAATTESIVATTSPPATEPTATAEPSATTMSVAMNRREVNNQTATSSSTVSPNYCLGPPTMDPVATMQSAAATIVVTPSAPAPEPPAIVESSGTTESTENIAAPAPVSNSGRKR